MKKTILTHLDTAKSAVASMVEVCSKSNKISLLKVSLNSTQAVLSETLDHMQTHPRVLPKTKKNLTAIRNTIQGMIDGLASQDLSVRDFRAICSNLNSKFVPQLEDSVMEEGLKLAKAGTVKGDDENYPDVYTPAPELPAHLQGLRSEVATGSSLQEMLLDIRKQLSQVSTRANLVPSQAPISDDDGDTSNAPKTSRELYEDREKADAAKHLANMATKRDNLPLSLKSHGEKSHAFTMVRLPLIPMFDQWTMTQEALLTRLNIPFVRLGGYAIFEEQILLIVSKTAAQAANKDSKTNKKDKIAINPETGRQEIKGKRMLDYTREAVPIVNYARVILDLINEQSSGSTYSLVSDHFVSNPRNQDLLCFWVMGTKKVSALIKAAGFGSAKVKNWGFPW